MDFKEQVEKAVKIAQQKAVEVKEISKIKYSIFDLNNDVKKLYFEIGKCVFEEMNGDSSLTENIQVKCDILESKLAKIKALKAKEESIRNGGNGITCPVCEKSCADDEEFCHYCGASLVHEFDAQVEYKDVENEL